MRRVILFLYWLPAISRTIWKHETGGFFVFRDESNEFLRFVLFCMRDGNPGELPGYFDQRMDEIAMRKRRGEWSA